MTAISQPADVGRDRKVLPRTRECDATAARELGLALGVSATIAQLLMHRGIRTAAEGLEFFEPTMAGLSDPSAMADRDAAAERLVHAVTHRERIVVFGDYDVDGTTSTAILTDVLEALGGEVAPILANRFLGGYGFSAAALERCMALSPKVIVTCDCGSSDHPRIADARARGVDVVVIDHHLVPAQTLPATAFLNPHRPECQFPYKGMASAGLAFSVGAAVRARLAPKFDMRPFLDLVALGTIADVAPLDGDNRRLVRAGLARITQGRCRPGIAALLEVAGARRSAPVGARDIAWKLAPRINAPGRLGDPTISLQLLRARTATDARTLASAVDAANQDRRTLEGKITEQALEQVLRLSGREPTHAVLAAHGSFHRGVVGISAARMADRFMVPACAIAIEDGIGHGSFRSYGGVDVHALLARAAPILQAFGGHAAAAGFTVREQDIEALRQMLIEAGLPRGSAQAGSSGEPRLVDLEIGDDFPLPRASELQRLEPVGAANEALRVLVHADVVRSRAVGNGDHTKLDLVVGTTSVGGFARSSVPFVSSVAGRAMFVGTLVPDSYRGGDAVQLEIESVYPG